MITSLNKKTCSDRARRFQDIDMDSSQKEKIQIQMNDSSRNLAKRNNSLRKYQTLLSVLIHRRFHPSSLYSSLSKSPSRSSVFICTLKFLRILGVIFALLVVLFNREGSYCVLSTLPFIQGLWFINLIRVRKYRSNLQVTRVFVIFPFISLAGTRSIFVPSPLQRGFYLTFVSARLDLIFDIWKKLPPPGVMSQASWILRI